MGNVSDTPKTARKGRKPRQKRTERDGIVTVYGKNPNGAGSVYYSKSAERWEAVGRHPVTNKRIKATARTREQAEQRLADKLDKLESSLNFTGPLHPDTATVEELLDYWLRVHAAPKVKPATLDTYRKRVAILVRHIGHRPISKVRKPELDELASTLGVELSPHTLKGTVGILRSAFGVAVDNEVVSTNPAARVRTKPAERVQRATLTEDQQRAVLVESLNPKYRYGLAVAMLFGMGLRVSEVLGLQWDDLDYPQSRVTIARAVTYTAGVGAVVGPTKTKGTAGVRMLPEWLHAPLQALQTRQKAERLKAGPGWETDNDGFVFRNTTGGLVVRQYVSKDVKRVCAALGIDSTGLGTHGGRRTVITNLFGKGADVDTIAAAVGHADPNTTRGYVQHKGDRAAKAAEMIGGLVDTE